MKNVLITGITGFLGKNLVEYFHQNKQVKIVGHSRDIQTARSKLPLFQVDFIKEISGKSLDEHHIDIVIHLAGIAHDLSGNYQPKDYDLVNNLGTRKLYDQFLESSASTFVFVSSIKAVVDHSDDLVNESIRPNPITPYGISKLEAEKFINQHSDGSKNNYILRPCMVHGPGNKGNLNLLYKFVKSGIPYPLGAFDNQRSFLSVENFCFTIENIINGLVKPDTYHLSDNESLSTNELVELIGEVIEKKPRIVNIPKPIIEFLAGIGSMLHLPFNNSNISKLTENQVVSNKKLLLNLGSNLPVSARQGLLKTIKSFDE